MTLLDLDRRLYIVWRSTMMAAFLLSALAANNLGLGWRIVLLAVAAFCIGVAGMGMYISDRLEEVESWPAYEEDE
jgi:hypothetical protein